jgi:reactive chlorine resistance protein C
MTTIHLDARRGRQLQSLGSTMLRLSLAFLLALFGTFKFFQFEADAIQPLVSHSPLLGWMYAVLSVRATSAVIGVVEVGAALALLLAPWWPRLGVVGGLVATGTFLTTLSFLATTPGLLAPGNDGTGFILKDLVLLGAALHVAGTSALAWRASGNESQAFPAAPAHEGAGRGGQSGQDRTDLSKIGQKLF